MAETQRAVGNSRLEVKEGKITKVQRYVEGPITVNFRAGIAANGDVTQINVARDGNFVSMTREQGISLAREILRRCGVK